MLQDLFPQLAIHTSQARKLILSLPSRPLHLVLHDGALLESCWLFKGDMARRAKLRAQATINAAVEARSRSKKVPSANPKHAPSDYVSWIDRQKLGGIWAEGLDSWPAKRIVDERVVNGVKQYRLEWVPHPLTGQRFPPSWVRRSR